MSKRPYNLTRRKTLLGLAACLGTTMAARAECLLTPDSGEGPFYFDPGLVRTDIRDRQVGAPLQLELQVIRMGDCAVLENARVDIWHANAFGLYSGYRRQSGVGDISSQQAMAGDYLRGTQFTDASGSVSFRTIYPSWYAGRTSHVHFKIMLDEKGLLASQVFFPDEINDDVFNNWGPYKGHVAKRSTTNANDGFLRNGVTGVVSDVQKLEDGYLASAVIAVDADT